MIIRELNEKDTDALIELKKFSLSTESSSFILTIEELPHYKNGLRKSLIEKQDVYIGAFDKGLIGFVSLSRENYVKRLHKASLNSMYLLPEYRTQGIGKLLVKKIISLAKIMNGLEEIQLIVSVESKNAINLYKKFGFEITWTEEHSVKVKGSYEDAHHMKLNLQQENFN